MKVDTRIHAVRLSNFKAYQALELANLPPLCVFVGENGTGKSTLFDVFGFLKDCLTFNVTKALQQRGGFKEVVSRGCTADATIRIELKFDMLIAERKRRVTYALEVAQEGSRSVVKREVFQYRRGESGKPFQFLSASAGEVDAITNEEAYIDSETVQPARDHYTLDAKDTLAIKGLGQFQRFKAANALRALIEGWHVSDFHITAARGSKDATAGVSDHLSVTGDNLQLVAKDLLDNHPDRFRHILNRMRECVPDVRAVTPDETQDGRLLLKFDGGFKDPFIDRYVSDGTIKMFAYLVLLNDPSPHPFLCVEEPENQLYHHLLMRLAEEFRDYARRGGQVFVSTHSPDFLDAASVDEVFLLSKGANGFTTVRRMSDSSQVKAYMEAGDKMGYLWSHGFFREDTR